MEISDLQIGDIGFSFKKRNILSKIIYRISIFNMAAKEAGLIKYSFGQLFVILFNKWFKIRAYDFSQKQMHCSEFISSIYERLNRKLTSQDSHMNSPIDIYESALLKDI